MGMLWSASFRHLLRHPVQLLLALLGLALGVATIVAVDVATGSAARAFELSLAAVQGPATHELDGGPAGIDEALVRAAGAHAACTCAPIPIVEGYVTVGDRGAAAAGRGSAGGRGVCRGSRGAAAAVLLQGPATVLDSDAAPGAVAVRHWRSGAGAGHGARSCGCGPGPASRSMQAATRCRVNCWASSGRRSGGLAGGDADRYQHGPAVAGAAGSADAHRSAGAARARPARRSWRSCAARCPPG